MARPKGDPGIKKQLILDAAVRVLNRKQYHECPVDEIAREAGIAKGTVYLYFKSKEDINFSVFFLLLDRLRETGERISAGSDPGKAQLRRLLEEMTQFMGEHRQIFSALRQELKPAKEKMRRELHRKADEMVAAIGAIIARGVREGDLREDYPPAVLGHITLALTSVIARQKMSEHRAMPDIPVETLFDVLVNGIGSRKDHPSS